MIPASVIADSPIWGEAKVRSSFYPRIISAQEFAEMRKRDHAAKYLFVSVGNGWELCDYD